ncbi:MAG: hypothetical protein JWR21_1341 [Herminiimonas sp.]|nr:hypothetical protein [Herminiimonas sp.]MDB5852619.1 hypothetical protein [Herminiimonas sp.]
MLAASLSCVTTEREQESMKAALIAALSGKAAIR